MLKNVQSRNKHRIDFEEAATVFGDSLSRAFPDPDHSVDEDRYIIIGTSDRGRVLIVSYTERESRTRIISARKATPQERKAYEEEN